MRIKNVPVFSSDSLAGNLASTPIYVGHIMGWAVQGSWTGTSPSGDIKLQVSCDEGRSEEDPTGVTNWSDTDTVSVATNTGAFLLNKDAQYARWVRVIYTRTSGTGSISARINLKGI